MQTKNYRQEQKNVRGVCQYDIEGHFIKKYSSIADAQRSIQNYGNVSAVLRETGVAQSAGGYQWRYDTGDYSDIPALHLKGRPVMQIDPNTYELIAEYHSMAEADRVTGVSNKQILKSCKRLHITSGGYIWRYSDDPDAFVPVKKGKKVCNTIPVCKYSMDGKFICSYESIADAERKNPGILHIGRVVNSKAIGKSAGGFMWKKDDGNHCDIEPYHVNGRWVEQIDMRNGLVIKRYPSISEAKRETGIQNIINVCNGKRHSAGGYFWRYIEEKTSTKIR